MKIGIIIGSTRQGRSTDRPAKWAAEAAKQLDDVEVEMLDLKDFDLPFFDEPISPQYNPERTTEGVVKAWLDKLAEMDGFIVVTPEYNRTLPAVVKNAFDYVAYELERKPIGIVAHGSTGGAQAVHTLRSLAAGTLAVTVPRTVYITPSAGMAFAEDGTLNAELAANPYGPNPALQHMLKDLVAYAGALKTIRG
ncbi:MAG TPA: NAD(P)H-dependent oxidoreductase [Patescibacteria group bacterium]|jgi:NAD(P)H-dependent FMN reductase|nr:NAD(P)H-dependent oxidoreductase [Patescibacteria group bacterium]